MPDLPFINFAFPATGAPANRTLPDRLSDVQNVKDWTATGNGVTNDYFAIQSAIQYCLDHGGGTVFFPAGTYVLGANYLSVGSSNPNVGVRLIGAGSDCVNITNSVTGTWGLSKGANTYDNIEAIENLTIFVSGSVGCIQITRDSTRIANCRLGGFPICVDASSCNNAFITGLVLQAGLGAAGTANPYPQVGSIGVALGNNCMLLGSRLQNGYDVAVAMSGEGPCSFANATEVHTTSHRVGWGVVSNVATEVACTGGSIMGLQSEDCDTVIDLYNATGCFVGGNIFVGADGVVHTHQNIPAGGAVWSGGTVMVTIPAGHNLPVGNTIIQFFNFIPIAYHSPPGITGDHWDPTTGGASFSFAVATRVNATQFTYPLSVNPAAAFVSGDWTYAQKYSYRFRKAYSCVVQGAAWHFAPTTYDFDYNGQADHSNNVLMSAHAEFGYNLPSNTKNLAGWNFIQCEGKSNWFNTAARVPMAKMIFSDLPGGGATQPGPFEGQEYDITDGQLDPSGGAATWNDPVKGGSTNHYRVRYDSVSTKWRRIG